MEGPLSAEKLAELERLLFLSVASFTQRMAESWRDLLAEGEREGRDDDVRLAKDKLAKIDPALLTADTSGVDEMIRVARLEARRERAEYELALKSGVWP